MSPDPAKPSVSLDVERGTSDPSAGLIRVLVQGIREILAYEASHPARASKEDSDGTAQESTTPRR